MLNLKFVTQLCHHLVVQTFAIVSNDSARQFVPAYQFSSYELRYYFTRDINIRGSFRPLGKIINCYHDNLGKFDLKSDEGIFLGYSLHVMHIGHLIKQPC